MKNIWPCIIIMVAIASCKSPSIVVSDDLKSNTIVMDAKGRQGLQFNQVIRFGDYTTSKVKRGWPTGFAVEFVVRFEKAQEKLSFTQYTPDSLQAEVLAVGKFKSTEVDFFNDFMGYSISFENTFTGTIIPAQDKENSWDFVVNNPDITFSRTAGCGIARDRKGNEITINGITRMEGSPSWAPAEVYGFGFYQGNQAIGAVSIITNGKVYMKNGLPAETRLVLAALSSSLMVRRNMSEVNK